MLIKNYFSALQLHWYWATTKKFKPQEPSQGTDISTRILKENSDLLAQSVLKIYNEVITTRTFPNILKYATVKPSYKKARETK